MHPNLNDICLWASQVQGCMHYAPLQLRSEEPKVYHLLPPEMQRILFLFKMKIGNLSFFYVRNEELRIKETIHDILKTSAEESLSPYEVAIARADLRMHDRRKTRWIKYLASRAKSN